MNGTYLTTDQLAERIHYDARTIRDRLKRKLPRQAGISKSRTSGDALAVLGRGQIAVRIGLPLRSPAGHARRHAGMAGRA